MFLLCFEGCGSVAAGEVRSRGEAMSSILLAVIGGGVGAGLGGLLGLGFDRVRRTPSQASLILGVAFAIGGAQVAGLREPKPATLEAQLDAASPAF
jgi:hypothetical protein